MATPDVDNRALTVLDLFAGAGGLSEGFRAAGGFRTVRAVEMDVSAAATYSLNHRSTRLHVGTIESWLDAGDVPQVDVIIGGPPCQGFSTLGKQDEEDSRNSLWREYARTIVKAEPTYFIVENVAAFLRSPQFHLFGEATRPGGSLADYDFRADVLNAADYGAPQARRRAVLIGHRRDVPFPGWPTRSHEGRHKTVRQAFETVRAPLMADLPHRTCRFGGQDLPGPFLTPELHIGRNYTELSLKRFASIPSGGNRFDIPPELLAPCWQKHTTGSGDVMGRLHWGSPSVTVRTEFFKPEKGRYLHPVENRAITHLEAAILQGFPLSYRWVGSRTSIARQIGNAVPIPLGEALAHALRRGARDAASS